MGDLLRIHTLGGLTLEYDGTPVTGFVSRKVEALLVYLACTHRPHAREVLAELLWPERSQSQSLANLRSCLSNLHQVLPSHVTITRRIVSLLKESPCWLDVAEFEHLIAVDGIQERRETVLSDDEANTLTKALDLYRGDFLQGFYVPDSRAFEDWAEMERLRLRRTVIEALHYLVLFNLEHGIYTDGIAQATRLLALDPLHDEINRDLILLLAQAGQRTQALAQYETYCRLLDKELGVKPSQDLVSLYRQIEAGGAVPARDAQLPPVPVSPVNPYKGLRAFQEADTPDFFGREALIRRLLAHLGRDDPKAHFLAVVGPSGCGKSSIVRAGLLPALRKGALSGSERWQFVTIMPGAYPLDELAISLRRLLSSRDADVMSELERDARGLLRVVKQTLPDDTQVELVLLIDQFEEIFSLVVDESSRRHVLNSLVAALADPHSRLRIVVTLRADFYDRPLLYPDLGEWVRQCTEVVLPLSPEELERAIVGPAERADIQVEVSLVTTIVADVNEQPGALPLLQYALTELFEHRIDDRLALVAYRANGGVRGALSGRADTLYAALDPAEQQVAQQVFLRLVQLGEGTEDTRRRVPWTEIVAVAGSETSARAVIDRFVNHRLLTLDHDPVTGGRTVELAHEALIREWRLLHIWIDESRADLRQQRLLGAAAAEWMQAGQDRSYLLTGSRLAQFKNWAPATTVVLTPDERRFLNASIAEHQRQRARGRLVRNVILTTAISVSVVMTLLALAALQARATVQKQRDRVQREAAVNRSLVLANAAMQVFEASEDGPGYALPLALEAVNMDQPPSKAVAVLRTIAFSAGTRAILREQGPAIKAVAFSPDSRMGLSGGCAALLNDVCTDGELILWDLQTRKALRHFEGHIGWVNGVAFSPDGKTILSGSGDQTLILWDVATGAIVRRFEGHTGAVENLALSPDGRTAVSGAADSTVRVWDVASGEALFQLPGTTENASEVAFSPDGTLVASSADHAVIILWDIATGQEIRRFQRHSGRVTALAFKVTGSDQVLLMSSATDDQYVEWDVETGQVHYQIATNTYTHHFAVSLSERYILNAYGPHAVVSGLYLDERFGHVESGAISPDERLLLLGHSSGLLRLCDMPTSAEVRRFEADVPLYAADVSQDGHYLLTGSLTGGRVILWDLHTGQVIRVFSLPEDVAGGTFSPDGRLAVLSSADSFGTSGVFSVVLVNVESGQEIHRLEGLKFPLRSAAFSPDGRYLLAGSLQWGAAWKEVGAGDLILWDVQTGTIVRRFEETRAVMGVAFSPDGRRAVTTGSEFADYISLWDVATGQLIRRYSQVPEIHFPQGVVWEPNGSRIIVGGTGSIGELDVETGVVTRVFSGLKCNTFYLDHSPDWRYLAGGDNCTPSTLMVWDLATGEEVEHFTAFNNAPIWSTVFNPNGRTVFTSSLGEKPIIEWQVTDWTLDELLAWVHENRYVRGLTCEERERYQIAPLCE